MLIMKLLAVSFFPDWCFQTLSWFFAKLFVTCIHNICSSFVLNALFAFEWLIHKVSIKRIKKQAKKKPKQNNFPPEKGQAEWLDWK